MYLDNITYKDEAKEGSDSCSHVLMTLFDLLEVLKCP